MKAFLKIKMFYSWDPDGILVILLSWDSTFIALFGRSNNWVTKRPWEYCHQHIFDTRHQHRYFNRFKVLAASSSMINPLIYGCTRSDLRQSAIEIFTKKFQCRRHHVNYRNGFARNALIMDWLLMQTRDSRTRELSDRLGAKSRKRLSELTITTKCDIPSSEK